MIVIGTRSWRGVALQTAAEDARISGGRRRGIVLGSEDSRDGAGPVVL